MPGMPLGATHRHRAARDGAGRKSGYMDPVNGASSERTSHTAAELADETETNAGLADQVPEPFEATIVRLDQSTAEELFRLATR